MARRGQVRRATRVWVLVVVVGLPVAVEAQTAGEHPFWGRDLRYEAQLGAQRGHDAGGIFFGGNAFARCALLQGGVGISASTVLLGGHMGSLYAMGGLGLVPTRWVRLDLLGVVGVRGYAAVGAGFLSDDPGASAGLGFRGITMGLAFAVFRRAGFAAELGARVYFEKDFERVTRRYSYVAKDWLFDNGSSEIDTEQRIGGSSTTLAVSFGLGFGG